MENLILEFLQKKLDQEFCSKIQFAPIPRGQSGDLAMSFFELAKSEKKSPPAITMDIANFLENCDFVEKTEIVGPYLNLFFVAEKLFEKSLAAPISGKSFAGKKVVLEFSGPNTNKPLHLGHMRNHALGIAMANTLEAAGAKIHRVNIINDRGVHICKSMLAYQKWGNDGQPNKKSDHFVGDWYVRFEQEVKKDESLRDEIQKMLVAWENGDPEIRKLWKKMSDWARSGHAETYRRQNINFEKEYHESEFFEVGKTIAEDGLARGIFKKRDDGAIVVDLTDEHLDEKVVLRADGTSIYLTQDLAVAAARKKDFDPDLLVYVVADEQNYHFKVLFSCLEKLGLIKNKKCVHLGYGLVHLPDGRMKSREGNVVDADNLMDELKNLATDEIRTRHDDWPDTEIDAVAEKIQDGAWKFFLLSTSPRKSITFDAKKSIQFEGATGPYLQYAGVRIQSILKKAGEIPNGDFSKFFGNAEKPLGVKILELEKVIDRAAETMNPTGIVTFLMELAQDWSSFYANNSVINADDENLRAARLQLAKKVLDVLERGIEILGFQLPEKM